MINKNNSYIKMKGFAALWYAFTKMDFFNVGLGRCSLAAQHLVHFI